MKTTATCNLNCSHCFTSGSHGKKIFFDPIKTGEYLVTLANHYKLNSMRILYHGGEPMLAPIKDLNLLYEITKDRIPNVSYGVQTNLVYRLTDERLNFFKTIIGPSGIGTSWDPSIRFGSSRPGSALQELTLWENNVRQLASLGHELTLMVSLSKNLVENYQPAKIITYAIDLGFKFILFERITVDGNASLDVSILPRNIDLDSWILQMYQDTKKFGFSKKIGNMFLDEIALSIVKGIHSANRCRGCEQKMITINADGTIAGCPNSATEKNWGSIQNSVEAFITSPGRLSAICKEKTRNINCYTCDVSAVCNGDCYKLNWEGDVCAAPKSLMRLMSKNNDRDFYKELII